MRRVNQLFKRRISEVVLNDNDFTNKIPLDLALILSKYDSKYKKLLENNYFSIKEVPYNKVVDKTKETSIRALVPMNDIDEFLSLETLIIENIKIFNFSSLINTTVQKLKLKNIDEIRFKSKMDSFVNEKYKIKLLNDKENKYNKYIIPYNFIPLTLKRLHLEDIKLSNTHLNILFSSSLLKLKLVNCKYSKLPSTNIPCISIINCKTQKEDIKISELNNFHFKEESFQIFYSSEITKKRRLKLKNCYDKFNVYFENKYENIEVLTIENASIQSIPVLKSLVSISLINCNINSTILNFCTNLQKISFKGTQVSPNTLYSLIDKYKNTLKHLDVSFIDLPVDFLYQIKTKLKKCKVIYKDMKLLVL